MREEHGPALPPELAGLEEQLAAMSPNAPRIDRDRLMFAAGVASAQPGRLGYIAEPPWLGERFWQTSTAIMTAATVLLAATLLWQRNDSQMAVIERGSHDATVVSDVESEDHHRLVRRHLDHVPNGYLGLRYIALSKGVGAIEQHRPVFGDDPSEPSSPVTARQLLEELLPKPSGARG